MEVLSNKGIPSGTWQCAEIMCSNGHYYTVRYDGLADETERVSKKVIRPSPPPEVSGNWAPGDVVEVLDNFSWKMAKVLEVSGKNHFFVRLLGSSIEFKVHKFDIRVRLSWHDGKWVIIGKGSGSCEEGKHPENLTLKYCDNSTAQDEKTNTRTNLNFEDDQTPVRNEEDLWKSYISSSKTLKRESYFQVEVFHGETKKFRAIEKDGRVNRVVAADPSTLLEQEDVVACPREIVGEKCLLASIDRRKIRISEKQTHRRDQNCAVGCSFAENLEPNEAESVKCSVGSCSIGGNSEYEFPRYFSSGPVKDDSHISDAESCSSSGYNEGICLAPTKEVLAAEIHRLELHAYRCTIEALHASGPLSWEKEALVTNLRISLNISNDEHLMELRNLISSNNNVHIR